MPDPTSTSSSSEPKKVLKAPRRQRGGLFNLILLIGIIVTIALFVWAEQQRREAKSKLEQTATELEELRKSAQASGQEVADEVLNKLRQHMDVPTDPQPTVATIVDADALKEANEFYQPAKNGDHLIITTKRAILYDPQRDIILDVVPVTVDPNQSPEASPTSLSNEASPAAEASPPADLSPTNEPTASPRSLGTPTALQATPTSSP